MLISQKTLNSVLDRLEGITYENGKKVQLMKDEKHKHNHDKFEGTYSPIPLLLVAIEMFPSMQERLIKHANTAGELAWQKGLKALKHNSLVTQGYLMLCLYRMYARMITQSQDKI